MEHPTQSLSGWGMNDEQWYVSENMLNWHVLQYRFSIEEKLWVMWWTLPIEVPTIQSVQVCPAVEMALIAVAPMAAAMLMGIHVASASVMSDNRLVWNSASLENWGQYIRVPLLHFKCMATTLVILCQIVDIPSIPSETEFPFCKIMYCPQNPKK